MVQYSHHLYMGYPLKWYNEMGACVCCLERQEENDSLATVRMNVPESER